MFSFSVRRAERYYMNILQFSHDHEDVRDRHFENRNASDVTAMHGNRTSGPEDIFSAGAASDAVTAAGPSRPGRAEMPYERFLSCGASSLTNAELLAIILRTGTKEKNATQLSREILGFFEEGSTDLSALHRMTLEDLKSIPGIGEVKAVKILSLAEISRRLVRERAASRLVFSSPSAVADYYMEQMRHLETETAVLVLLDNKMALLREEVLSLGTVNCTLLSPREIFLRALRWGAVNIMLLHNHPSGDPTPSGMDKEITERICKAGQILGIQLIDHLIIGDLSFTSLRECGCIPEQIHAYT